MKDAVKHIVNAEGEKKFSRAAKNLEEKAGITIDTMKKTHAKDAEEIMQ